MASNVGNLTGHTLGTCILTKQLGQGGMGAVYLAQQSRPVRNVAIKVLLSNLTMNSLVYEEFLERFRREADVIARLEHVNIMPIYEYGEQDGRPYLVMPYLAGGSLSDVLLRQGPLSLTQATIYIDQACSALDYAHAQGVIHRDLKPANFLLHSDGRLILADFGIARMVEQNTGSTLTSAGSVLGTPDYMAPEMFNGDPVDYRADIYELGVVLFQMLSGKVPFTGSSPYAVALLHMRDRLPLLNQLNPSIPQAVDMVIQKATAKRREDRYSSAQAMAQALQQACSVPTPQSSISRAWNNTPPPVSERLVLPAPQQQYNPGYASTPRNGQYNNPPPMSQQQSANQAPYFHSTGYQSNQQTKKRPIWGILVGWLIIALLIGGGVFIGGGILIRNGVFGGLQIHNDKGPAVNTVYPGKAGIMPTTRPPDQPPTKATILTPAVPLANNTTIYSANNPGCEKKKATWVEVRATLKCVNQKTSIANTNPAGSLGGIFINHIPGITTLADSTFKVQIHLTTQNNTEFGVTFRTSQKGGYAFILLPTGHWNAYSYDNTTGQTNSIASGLDTINDLLTPVTITVATHATQFSFYINDTFLGNAIDATYTTGLIGIIVGHNGTIGATNFSLSTANP